MAGTISRIRLENFMCHSSLHIELGEHVNFITGQNGSGKSAILTALCIAFGCRAKNTQRAATIKDFIKTGCSYAAISVDINNQGEDSFKPDVYGNLIKLERRITESSSSTILKDQHGRKVANRKDDLNEIIEHFNIDVENPCVIMSQDKSREFLHSGNDKDKFKFFFKATLLQQVNELLETIRDQLNNADSVVQELEKSIKPVMRELDELREKIKNMEHIEEIAHDIDNLKKKLAWSWVYEVDQQIEEQTVRLQKLKERIPACQERIDRNTVVIDDLKKELTEKEELVRSLGDKTHEVNNMKKSMEDNIAEVVKLKIELEAEHERGTRTLEKMNGRLKQMQAQLRDFQMQHMQFTQAEASQIEEDMQNIQRDIDYLDSNVTRLREEEKEFSEELSGIQKSISDIAKEIAESDKRILQLKSHMDGLQQRQSNTVTAFGGQKVLKLLQLIESNHGRFKSPPIGPIGAHLQLASESWSVAVDCACGGLLDAFIVSCHKDLQVLRECAGRVYYNNLRIIVYDFTRQRLIIPDGSLPTTEHPTVLSVIQSENHTVLNVLVDQGHAERQVLVRDYEVGKSVAFDHRMRNIKEVYTSDGFRMFSRGSVQTILPPNKRPRPERWCSSPAEKIAELKNEADDIQRTISEKNAQRRKLVNDRSNLEQKIANLKRKREPEERHLMNKKVQLEDAKRATAENNRHAAVDTTELEEDIKEEKNNIEQKELSLQKTNVKLSAALREVNDRRMAFKTFMDSVNEERLHFSSANDELDLVKRKIDAAQQEKTHYEGVMTTKVLPDIKTAEAEYADLQQRRQEYFKKASIICSESDMEALSHVAGSTPEQLSAKINRLKQRFDQESRRYAESIDDLRALHDKKERKILRKQQLYAGFRVKLNSCQKALDLRWKKFQRNAGLLKRQLTWLFNEHLGKKGISGFINVDYKSKVLSVELTMPQDASRDTVRDTRGLSGGERSFSTLCFTLALHGMTEAPFRAMDEFDVFMDAVSRKISLDTLVDFAVAHGSQWVFITPHDISMVKPGDRVKKQQMAAPRG
ncbi:structural maintenance of chromosomes protein 6B [Aegilops tauschii subsp. strangulata]|uniref:Rad50/SbcC-type AAA domain-containing protein n=4 Tax=Aegilops tauschii subsp. strangulata TaxID=200361 RepID=A0A453KG99_AEGTS|nr:structural maintenance of chromosomes protein 6B [Aegilops tauschii subsp. strangulata]